MTKETTTEALNVTSPTPKQRSAVPSCANNSKCNKSGTLHCARCQLVGYCSSDCQREHWRTHKVDCNNKLASPNWRPDWDLEMRAPTFVVDGDESHTTFGKNIYLWGNMPALDLFNIKKNEGHMDKISVCIAASGDIRNVAYSFASANDSDAATSFSVVINDVNPVIVLRNLVLLTILCSYEPTEAAEIALHMCYSCRLKPSHHAKIMSILRSKLPVSIVEDAMKRKYSGEDCTNSRDHVLDFGSTQILVSLTLLQWSCLVAYMKGRAHAAAAELSRRAVMIGRMDRIHRHLFRLKGHERVSMMNFRLSGVFLPFSASDSEFTEVNPFFYSLYDGEWLLNDSGNPVDGWDFLRDKKFRGTGVPKNDLYGDGYFYIINVLEKFSSRLQDPRFEINMHMTCKNASELPTFLNELSKDQKCKPFISSSYDRIEVSNICDKGYLGIEKVLDIFSPLLKPPQENPHSTLLTLFINATHEAEVWSGEREDRTIKSELYQRIISLYGQPDSQILVRECTPELILLIGRAEHLKDFPRLFEKYAQAYKLEELADRNHVKPKQELSIVSEEFPGFIHDHFSNNEQVAKLEWLARSGINGGECYVEWAKV